MTNIILISFPLVIYLLVFKNFVFVTVFIQDVTEGIDLM